MAKHSKSSSGSETASRPPLKAAAVSSPAVERPSAPQAKLTLADVRIQDFRGLRDLCTTLDPLTVVIGENNADKTSFLQGLAVLFGPNRPSHDDFYVGQDGMRSEHFVIDVRLRPSEGADFDDGMRARFKGAIQFADASCDSEYSALDGSIPCSALPVRTTWYFCTTGSNASIAARYADPFRRTDQRPGRPRRHVTDGVRLNVR